MGAGSKPAIVSAGVVGVSGAAAILAVPVIGILPILGWCGGILSLGVLASLLDSHRKHKRIKTTDRSPTVTLETRRRTLSRK